MDVVKERVEEKKLESGHLMDEVCTWCNEIDAENKGIEAEIEYPRKHLSETRQQSQLADKEQLCFNCTGDIHC